MFKFIFIPNLSKNSAVTKSLINPVIILDLSSPLTSPKDTLELFTGCQYIVDTYIQGDTYFIFDTNNTTYFKGS